MARKHCFPEFAAVLTKKDPLVLTQKAPPNLNAGGGVLN